jgi:SnoaL-like domain
MAAVAGLLADDVAFESPRVALSGAGPVLEAMGQFAQAVTGVSVLAVVGDDERAMIMYDMQTRPFGTLRAVDHLVVRDGRITSDTLVFDTYEVRKGGGRR